MHVYNVTLMILPCFLNKVYRIRLVSKLSKNEDNWWTNGWTDGSVVYADMVVNYSFNVLWYEAVVSTNVGGKLVGTPPPPPPPDNPLATILTDRKVVRKWSASLSGGSENKITVLHEELQSVPSKLTNVQISKLKRIRRSDSSKEHSLFSGICAQSRSPPRVLIQFNGIIPLLLFQFIFSFSLFAIVCQWIHY